MADNLNLRVKIDTTQADKSLDRIYRSMGKIDKALNGGKRGLRELATESNQTATALNKATASATKASTGMTILGRTASTASGVMKKGFSNMGSMLTGILRTTSLVSALLS